MSRADSELVHSVAFRVSEEQWVALQQYAATRESSIPQVAKEALFERAGLKPRAEDRRRYGQAKRGATSAKTG